VDITISNMAVGEEWGELKDLIVFFNAILAGATTRSETGRPVRVSFAVDHPVPELVEWAEGHVVQIIDMFSARLKRQVALKVIPRLNITPKRLEIEYTIERVEQEEPDNEG